MTRTNKFTNQEQIVLAKITMIDRPQDILRIFKPIRSLYSPMAMEDDIIPVKSEDMRILLNLVTVAITPLADIVGGTLHDLMAPKPNNEGGK